MTLKTETLVTWLVRFGVDQSHCIESTGNLHRRKRNAMAEFARVELGWPWKYKEVVRLEFPRTPMAVASSVSVVRRERWQP